MKAMILTAFGKPLASQEVPEPGPVLREALVEARAKWVQIIASHNHSVRDVVNAATLVSDGRVRAVISAPAPMQEANEALAQLRAGDPVGRVVLQW